MHSTHNWEEFFGRRLALRLDQVLLPVEVGLPPAVGSREFEAVPRAPTNGEDVRRVGMTTNLDLLCNAGDCQVIYLQTNIPITCDLGSIDRRRAVVTHGDCEVVVVDDVTDGGGRDRAARVRVDDLQLVTD